jgi:transcriptional regulator with XRE-family HTH domain
VLGDGQAERLKSMRKRLDWSLADLAAASGVSIRTIRDIENGKKKGTSGADVMAALADALRVPRGWLTFGG